MKSSKIKDIIKNLKEFQVPQFYSEQQLSDAERTNLYFYLTSYELENQKQIIEEKQPDEVILKKIKIQQVVNDGLDEDEIRFNSFSFKQEERNFNEPDKQQVLKDQTITFNTIGEIKEFLKQYYQERKTNIIADEIQQIDRQQVIQSLNIQIQQSNINVNEIIDVFLSILFKEIELSSEKRYQYYLDTFCALIKQKASLFILTSETQEIAYKFVTRIPKYRISCIDLLREFTEQALNKQIEKMYEIYFTLLRDLVFNFILDQNPLQLEAFRQLLRINHQSTLDFVKHIKDIVFQKQEIRDIVFEETISKINCLNTTIDCSQQLTFIFYVGCYQYTASKHCKILAKLLQDCESNYPLQLENIYSKLTKLKENIQSKQLIKFIGLSITNGEMLNQKLLDLFVEYLIQTNENGSQALELYKIYLIRYFNQQLDEKIETLNIVNKIIQLTFDQMNIQFIISTVDKISLDKLRIMILKKGQGQFDLYYYIQKEKEEDKFIAVHLVKLFLKKEDSLLRENGYELLKIFLEQIIEYNPTKAVLLFLFKECTKPMNGLIATFMQNCLKKKKADMQEEIRFILENNNYCDDEHIIKAIVLYKTLYPDRYSSLLDDQIRMRIKDNRLL